jgi:hypothetical protein
MDNTDINIKKFNDFIKTNNIEIEKLDDESYELVGINDISTEKPKDINEAIIINADLNNTEVKRGDHLYITAMLKKKDVNWNTMAVLKVRIIDMFNGLSILNSLK